MTGVQTCALPILKDHCFSFRPLGHAERRGENRLGPNLFGIVGKRAGTAPGFKYTNAFRNTATFEWTEGLLGPWIALPAVMVPGTAMGVFPGVSDRDKDDIVAYVAAQK